MADRTNIIVGAASVAVDGVDAGYTKGGVTQTKPQEILDIDADQVAGVIAKEVTGEKMFIKTTLLESTLANIRMAMNEPAGNAWSGSGLALGSAAPTITEHTLTLVGKGPAGKTRTVNIFRAVSVEEIETGMFRDQASVIPVTFECLKDPANGNKFGNIIDTA